MEVKKLVEDIEIILQAIKNKDNKDAIQMLKEIKIELQNYAFLI